MHKNKRSIWHRGLFLIAALLAPTTAPAQTATPQPTAWVHEYIEGSPKAPIEITLYFSPAGKASSASYLQYHPWLAEHFIAQNIVRIRYHELATTPEAADLIAALHCLPKEDYLSTLSGMMALNASPNDRKDFLDNIWKKSGLSEAPSSCLKDQALNQWVTRQKEAARYYSAIKEGPIYVFNNSAYRLDRTATYESFQALIPIFLPR